MKKTLLTIAIAAAAFTTQAQNFRLGLGGAFNTTWLANTNVADQGDNLDFAVSFGGSIGLEGIYSFNDKAGISIGFLYSGQNQKYDGKVDILGTSESFNSTVRMRYLDFPILFRLTSPGGTYFELGPQIGVLSKAEEEAKFAGQSQTVDTKASFNSANIAAVLGFGVDIDVSDNIVVTTGLRLGYGLGDVTKEYSSEAELAAADNVGTPDYYAHYDNKGKFGYQKTSRIFGGLHLGVSYKLGAAGAKK